MADAGERLKAALADRYRIERELGAGGMATVYLAEDLKAARLSGGLAAIRANLAGAYARTGQRDRARAILREFDQAVSMPQRPMYIAHIAEALGETDVALEWLEKAFEARSPS